MGTWFDKESSELLDWRKQAGLQWLQDQNQIDGDNLKNGRCEEPIQAGTETVCSGIHELINTVWEKEKLP
jgi:hypothetical protein